MKYNIIETKERVTADNEKAAAELRAMLKERKIFFINLMASPGAGKTTLLSRTIQALKGKYRIGVMEADVDSSVDAETISALGAKVIQLHSGGLCHMDADMTARGIEAFDLSDLDILFLENIGNLVCPAEFDVGAEKRVMILSVPEGDDKPLKYPLMFQVCQCVLINKTDTREWFAFDDEAVRERILKLNPEAKIIFVSAKTGEGFDEWADWIRERAKAGQRPGK